MVKNKSGRSSRRTQLARRAPRAFLFFLLGFTCGADSAWHALQTDFALFSQRGLGGALTPGPSLVLVGVSIGALQFTAYE